jgi:hypothetical protein
MSKGYIDLGRWWYPMEGDGQSASSDVLETLR